MDQFWHYLLGWTECDPKTGGILHKRLLLTKTIESRVLPNIIFHNIGFFNRIPPGPPVGCNKHRREFPVDDNSLTRALEP